jgi:hypothetical protein
MAFAVLDVRLLLVVVVVPVVLVVRPDGWRACDPDRLAPPARVPSLVGCALC